VAGLREVALRGDTQALLLYAPLDAGQKLSVFSIGQRSQAALV
jgi:hypothetical protein